MPGRPRQTPATASQQRVGSGRPTAVQRPVVASRQPVDARLCVADANILNHHHLGRATSCVAYANHQDAAMSNGSVACCVDYASSRDAAISHLAEFPNLCTKFLRSILDQRLHTFVFLIKLVRTSFSSALEKERPEHRNLNICISRIRDTIIADASGAEHTYFRKTCIV